MLSQLACVSVPAILQLGTVSGSVFVKIKTIK